VARRPGGRSAMRGTLRRLQQLGDCLDSPSS
jgi:hypothetical protein